MKGGFNLMLSIFDVANWFLSKESMTPKKLQKLCYYYKAWGLALYDEDLLPNYDFEAWVHGPVNPALYKKYVNFFWQDIPKKKEDNSNLFNEKEIDLLESVWITYGKMSANALEAQTHVELPWKNARVGFNENENCKRKISNDDMKEFYRELYSQNQGE